MVSGSRPLSFAERQEFITDLEDLGAPPDVIQAKLAERDGQDEFLLLDEFWPAWDLYSRMRTQWRTGMSGIVGLDMNIAFQLMDRMDMPSSEQLELCEQLQLIEHGILDERHKNKDT